jgi:hypothetical protein
MPTSYSSFCDDFYIDTYVNTKLELPTNRETLLAFFEQVRKHFPSMGGFFRRENGVFCLEESQESGQYRCVTVESDRIGAGFVNPPTCEEAYALGVVVIELAPYMLGVSPLDIDLLDVTFAMEFDCPGNHDEIVAEALAGSTAFTCLQDLPGGAVIGFSPSIVIGLGPQFRTQVRISVESGASGYEPRADKYKAEEPITLYFTVRQYPLAERKFDAVAVFRQQCVLAEELMVERVLPNFVRPLVNVIAQRRSGR